MGGYILGVCSNSPEGGQGRFRKYGSATGVQFTALPGSNRDWV